jgi:hypothetical protein
MVCIARDDHVWHALTQIVSKEYDNPNLNFLPFLLVFIWVASIVMLHMNIYQIPQSEDLLMIIGLMKNAIKLCIQWIPIILRDHECVKIIKNWFPFVLSYARMLQCVNRPSEDKLQELDGFSRIHAPELMDNIWIGRDAVLKAAAFPPSPKMESGRQFMLNLVNSIFITFQFQIPFPQAKYDLNWLVQSPVIHFITQIIAEAPTAQFESIVLSFFSEYYTSQHESDFFAPVFIHTILTKLSHVASIDLLIEHLSALVGLISLPEIAMMFMQDLLGLMDVIRKRKAIVSLVHHIFLVLFRAIHVAVYFGLFTLLTKHVDSFFLLSIPNPASIAGCTSFSRPA